jgi:uncharacterized lipoprotein
MSCVRVIALLPAIVVLGACSGKSELTCAQDTRYREAVSVETLRIPDDLSVPDESGSLRIPGASPPTAASAAGESTCLEESPAFSSAPAP